MTAAGLANQSPPRTPPPTNNRFSAVCTEEKINHNNLYKDKYSLIREEEYIWRYYERTNLTYMVQNSFVNFLTNLRGLPKREVLRVKIFKALELEGITGENGIDQAADEIVQHLRKQNLINTFENSKNVRLTDDGLDEAKKICRGS